MLEGLFSLLLNVFIFCVTINLLDNFFTTQESLVIMTEACAQLSYHYPTNEKKFTNPLNKKMIKTIQKSIQKKFKNIKIENPSLKIQKNQMELIFESSFPHQFWNEPLNQKRNKKGRYKKSKRSIYLSKEKVSWIMRQSVTLKRRD
jgi:hypothetical protein